MRKYSLSPIFSQLPVELVDEIAYYSDIDELTALCLVSRQTGNVATRRLYDTIVLKGVKCTVICLRTLATRQDVADCVKRVGIRICSRSHLFQGFYRLAAEAFRRTVNLIGLDIQDLDSLTALLIDIPFPRLLEVKLPYAPSVTRFLQSHRHTLKAIVIQGIARAEQVIYPEIYFKGVEMPELLAFVGPCTVVPFVVPKSQVSFLTVCWEPGHDRPEEIVKCIAESRTDVVGMDNLVVGWNPELLGMIATHLPKMERLRIRNAYAFPKELMERYLLFLEEGLQKFECLKALTINLLNNPYPYLLPDLDKEHAIVQRWGSLLPTLDACTLLSDTRWTRYKGNYWLPLMEMSQMAHITEHSVKTKWFVKAFLVGTYPRELFPDLSGGVDLDDFREIIPSDFFSEGEEEEEEIEEGEGADWHDNENEDDAGSDWESEGSDGSAWGAEEEGEETTSDGS